ncbi:hypothetical protein [Serinicoccus sp. CNJ-927]|uniref:hypothetical protein n=1 Tax=Serinicoccus sp. CNJ-927 TaxID=1904970 RepID=UPI00130118CD
MPRAQAGAASRNSARESHARPLVFIATVLGLRRTRDAMWKTSPSARTATVTVTMEIPSKSSGMPNVERSVADARRSSAAAGRRPSSCPGRAWRRPRARAPTPVMLG